MSQSGAAKTVTSSMAPAATMMRGNGPGIDLGRVSP